MAQPLIICLKSESNNKYLRYQGEDVYTHGYLQFSADKVTDPFAQFELVKSKTYDDLYHIRSRYNDKFWVRASPRSHWIIAYASKPNENQSSWGCTLFKPIYIGDREDQKMRVLHVQLGRYLKLYTFDPTIFVTCLFADQTEAKENDPAEIFSFIYWDSVFKLPKMVAFKSDNGKYLGTFVKDGLTYLQFSYDDVNDPKVAHEMVVLPNGTFCIKSTHTGKFWSLGTNNWILVDADQPRDDDASKVGVMFNPRVVDIKAVALRSMSVPYYCKRYSHYGLDNCMNAATQKADQEATLQVIDLATMC